MADEAYPDAMPIGYRLHWYVLEHVLGQGGFGITYLARDTNLDRRVAIKEYLPTDYAQRRSDAEVRPRTHAQVERYAWGLERFLSEARTLARFEHPNIVRVNSVFEANNTAYMVMRFEEGEDLATLLERYGTLPERQLVDCLLLVLDGLQLVHDAGFIHRDIKPENIYVRKDGSPVLLDFGSARQSLGRAKTMTILVAPGYAPLEQYYGEAATQGPWTDIYGLGATCYRAITGRAPLDAVARAKGVLGSAREMLAPATEVGRGRYSERFLAAVDHALQLSERDRPQSIAEWRRELVVAPAAVEPQPPAAPELRAAPPARQRGPRVWSGALAAGALLAIGTVLLHRQQGESPSPAPPAPAPAASEPPRVESKPPDTLTAIAAPNVASDVAKGASAPSPALPSVPRQAAPAIAAPARPVAKPVLPSPAVPRHAPDPAEVAVVVTQPPPAAAQPTEVASAVLVSKSQEIQVRRKPYEEQLDAAEASLRRGDHAGAARLLTPLAEAGVSRAQFMLGRTFEESGGTQHSNFAAYLWYGKAVLAGDPDARTRKEKIAAKLHADEIRQADRVIQQQPLRPESSGSAAY